MKPFLLVLSSPSGGGKSTIARHLLQGRDDLGYSISATTRPRREHEVEGRDYFFLSRKEFVRRRDAGEFVEWATYSGHLYGTLRSELERIFTEGRHAVLDIEVEGARQVRKQFPNAVHLFVLPPTGAALGQRLRERRTEAPAVLRSRLERAAEELTAVEQYDYVVENDDLAGAVEHVAAVIDAEAHRVSRQADLPARIEQLRREVAAEVARIPEG